MRHDAVFNMGKSRPSYVAPVKRHHPEISEAIIKKIYASENLTKPYTN